jgi:hypothetical protein
MMMEKYSSGLVHTDRKYNLPSTVASEAMDPVMGFNYG